MTIIARILSVLTLFAALQTSSLQASTTDSAKTLFDKLLAKNSSIHTLTFEFTQQMFIADSTQTVSATIYYKKPANFKAIYSEPYKQEIYYDKGFLYTFIPSIKQATKQAKQTIEEVFGFTASIILSSDPFTILSSKMNIKDFRINSETKNQILYLSDKNRTDYLMDIEFNSKTYMPIKTIMKAKNFSSQTVFKNYLQDQKYEPNFFVFDQKRAERLIEID